jgi:hypothetical protein
MARPIRETPVLRGKEAKEFLRQMEENKNKKTTPEELARIKESAEKLISISDFEEKALNYTFIRTDKKEPTKQKI